MTPQIISQFGPAANRDNIGPDLILLPIALLFDKSNFSVLFLMDRVGPFLKLLGKPIFLLIGKLIFRQNQSFLCYFI